MTTETARPCEATTAARRHREPSARGEASERARGTPLRTTLPALLAPARCAPRLALLALVLVALHVGLHVWHFRVAPLPWLLLDLFDLDEEQAFGTWFSSALLMSAAACAFLCSQRVSSSELMRRYWRVLGGGFVLLSIDEVAGVHEAINTATELSWAIPAGLLALAIGAAYLPFLARLPLRTRTLLLYAGLVYLGGAVGVELTAEGFAERGQLETLAYALVTALEEGMEMGGVVLFVYAALDHLESAGSHLLEAR